MLMRTFPVSTKYIESPISRFRNTVVSAGYSLLDRNSHSRAAASLSSEAKSGTLRTFPMSICADYKGASPKLKRGRWLQFWLQPRRDDQPGPTGEKTQTTQRRDRAKPAEIGERHRV